jgi:hypothetical protein
MLYRRGTVNVPATTEANLKAKMEMPKNRRARD